MNSETSNSGEQQTLVKLITKYSGFFQRVKAVRLEREEHSGHGFKDHDLLVAQYCTMIAPTEEVGELAWLAALLHSYDRVFKTTTEVDRKIDMALLNLQCLLPLESIELIEDAVEKHSGKNEAGDSPILITLRDADRLANIGPTWIIRMGQHHSKIPAVELEHVLANNPQSTYKEPRSCLDELRFVLEEWPDDLHCPGFGMRLPKAKVIAQKYFNYLRAFVELTQTQYRETGILVGNEWVKV